MKVLKVFITERWNSGLKRFVKLKPLLIVQFDMKSLLRRVGDMRVRLIQIPCISAVDKFTRFKRWGKRISIIYHKFQLRTIGSM